MQLRFTDGSTSLAARIPSYRGRSLSYRDASYPERVTERVIGSAGSIADLRGCNLAFLFDYRIFPPAVMQFAAEWLVERRPMRVGDVIVQQVYLPPWPAFSVKAIFAVRIMEIASTRDSVGFRYGTLAGHAETGVSEFSLVRDRGSLRLRIRTWSRPAGLARLLGAVVARPYQAYCTNRALDRMAIEFARANLA